MRFEQPNPVQRLLMFKKEMWVRDYSVRMQKWFSGIRSAPLRIDAELHRRCNLECIQCNRRASPVDMTEESKTFEVPDERWLAIANESGQMGVKAWNIAGIAEPMCKPELTLEFMETIKRHHLFGELTTNGTLWSEKQIRDVVTMRWDSVGISLDAGSAEIHDYLRGVGGTFERATRTMELFRFHRDRKGLDTPCLTLNMVLNNRNYKDLPEMIHFARSLGADAIFVEPMIVYTPEGEELKLSREQTRELPPIIERAKEIARKINIIPFISCIEEDDEIEVDEFKEDLVDKTSDIKEVILNQSKETEDLVEKYTVIEDLHRREEAIKEREFGKDVDLEAKVLAIPCYYPWFNLMITGDGSVVHCGECTELIFNIKQHGLAEIWYGDQMRQTRKAYAEGHLPTYCDRCRPNVINDMQIVRKSVLEYGSIKNLHHEYVKAIRENEQLRNELYWKSHGKIDRYRKGKLTAVSKARKIYGILKS